MNKLSQLVSATGMVVVLAMPMTTYAFSKQFTSDSVMGKGLPSTVTVSLISKPSGPFKQGDEVQFIETVYNKGSKPVTVETNLGLLSAGQNKPITKAELRDISGTPNEVSLTDFFDPGWNYPATEAVWKNQVIPAKSKKEFSMTAKLFFGDPKKLDYFKSYGFVGALVPNLAAGNGISDFFTMPVSQQKTSAVSSKKKPIDHLFYAAFKHYPTDKERPYWEKRFTQLRDVGNFNRVGFLFKEMKAAAAKQVKTK